MSHVPSGAVLLALLMLAGCGGRADPPADSDAHAHAPVIDADADRDAHAHAGGNAAEHGASTRIAAAEAEAAGIGVARVTAGTIADEHEVQGLLAPVDGRVAQVAARFPGVVRALQADVGDRVRAGQTLARIDSNLSLTTYGVAAPMAGVVLARHAQVGAVVGEGGALFEVGDLSELWVDLHIFGNDTQHITAGVPVMVTRMTDGVAQATTLERVLPGTATASQSTVARARLRNEDGLWRPGAAVRARIAVAMRQARRVVPLAALQSMQGRDVVFVRTGELYSARTVRLGARDARQVEVLEGVTEGEHVVVGQSYLIKADIAKAEAAHEH